MHVYPQRDRIGFHDIILNEEGRHHLGLKADDYELFLAEQGYAGQELTHGMCTNDYMTRPWHLPEHCHPTNWTTREMCKCIKRRDPTRPAFWYMSFNAAHPPLVPLEEYMDMYRDLDIPARLVGDWAADFEELPYALKVRRSTGYQQGHPFLADPAVLRQARAAYYAMCTHVDHQIRLVIGMLREEGLLDNTIVVFTADHGDMLGHHNQFAKDLMYEDSVRVPMILMPTAGYERVGNHLEDDRLVELRDVMPTLLDLAGLEIPDSVEGISLASDASREYLSAEHWEDARANRMVRDSRYKLIYYPVGNRVQLFDLDEDPDELHDLAAQVECAETRERLTAELIRHMYGGDLDWVRDGRLVGLEEIEYVPEPDRALGGQRGWRFM